MASKRKTKPLKGNGVDNRADYGEFMAGLLGGTIRAERLVESSVPNGSDEVRLARFDEQGQPLPDVVITVQRRRLTKLEYDEPAD